MYKLIQFSFHILTLQNCVRPILMIHDVIANRNHNCFDHILGLTARVSLGHFLRDLFFPFWDFFVLCSPLLYSLSFSPLLNYLILFFLQIFGWVSHGRLAAGIFASIFFRKGLNFFLFKNSLVLHQQHGIHLKCIRKLRLQHWRNLTVNTEREVKIDWEIVVSREWPILSLLLHIKYLIIAPTIIYWLKKW